VKYEGMTVTSVMEQAIDPVQRVPLLVRYAK
jgi:hypothetical protein